MIVEWCVRNERYGTRKAIENWHREAAEEGGPTESDTAQRYTCLDLCDICVRQPFALVDNGLAITQTAEALQARLIEMKLGEARAGEDAQGRG